MSTYSLTLRSEKNSRLSIAEMDNNFLYLEELALSGTASAIDLTNLQTDIIPAQDSVYSLGTSASQWESLHVSGGTIYVGGVPISTHDGSLVINSINLGTTASPLILSAGADGNKLSLNGGGYKGFYAGINRLSGEYPNITQIVISKSANAIYKNKTDKTDNDDFYVSNLAGSDTVVILNIYGADNKKPLKLKDIRNFVEKFVDIVLHTNETLNSDLTVIKELFYDNIQLLTNSLPTGSLYKNFAFQEESIEYILTPSNYNTTSMTGSGTFSLFKGNEEYYFGGEGGANDNFTFGFQEDDIITISGTALGGQSPDNDVTIYVNDIDNGTINTYDIFHSGSGYTNGFYSVYSPNGSQAYAYITTSATGSVTGAQIIWPGSGYTVDLGEGYTIYSGNEDASIRVLSIRDGVINGYNVVGTPDYRSPYRNSENPWPVTHILDGGNNQYDRGNFITTDKSITEFVGSIEDIGPSPDENNILTVTEIISGTLSVGQSIRHNLENYRILTGTLNGGVGTYSVSDYYQNDRSEQVFKAYGFNYGGGEVVENNTFGTGSSYVTLYDESIFAMIAINTDINEIYYTGDHGSDDDSTSSKKVTNVLIADNNTLSFGDEKLELSNKDLILPESETLGWMSVLGPLYNNDDDIVFNSTVIDDYGNTYAVGYEDDDNNAIVVKFNKSGDKLWSREIYDDYNGDSIEATSVKIDPVNGDLVVLCEINPNYTEALIVRIDPVDGDVKISHRLKDLNVLEEQGDIYLRDMTFNSDNELIIVGEKTTAYLEWTIATSSVLLGSTFSTLVISPSSIDNNIPDGTSGWSIAGTGIIGDENLEEINYFEEVTGTLTPGGVGAAFTIQSDNVTGEYTILSVDTPGTGYNINILKPIVVPGTSLGGATPANDATILQTDVEDGGIVSAEIYGNSIIGGSPSGTQSFAGVTGSTVEGSGANFDIEMDPFNGEYYWDDYSGQQANYVVNDIITIPGSVFGGTSSNDCIITVTSVTDGIIEGISISGTGSTASLYLTINTNVNFSASGTWSIYKTLPGNGEAYIYTENWERTLIGDESNERFESVITDENNNIYCVGTDYSDNDIEKAIISKFNQNGVHQWTKVLNEIDENCYGESVAIFGTNSVITTHYSDDSDDIIISKLALNGDLIWQKRTDSNGGDSAVATDSTGIYVAVKYDDNNFYNNFEDYYPNTIRLFKINSDGVVIWNNTIGGREDFNLSNISIKNEIIAVAGYTYVMADDYYNAFIANLPTDGTLALEQDEDSEYSGITSYVKGEYRIRSVTSSEYESITPQTATHSITYTRDRYIYTNTYDIDNNIDKINEESGIIFGDGTKQTSSPGIIPQNYRPHNEDYYLQLSDIGKHIYRDTDGTYRVYIPTNENVPFPIGTAITVVSGDSSTRFDLDDSGITKLWGAGLDGNNNNFYIPSNSMATLLKIGIDKWMVSGAGLEDNWC
jgi:hypothetical protein